MALFVFDDPDMDLHEPELGHVERPDRLRAARAAMTGYPGLEWRRPRFATRDDLVAVHDVPYVDGMLAMHGSSMVLDADTEISPGSIRAALLAAGAVQDAVEHVLAGPADHRAGTGTRAVCLVRPPGHHASSGAAMGFCLFNNVVVGVSRALRSGLERVLVVDWDVHHGNGTQEMVQDHPGVLFASLHQGFGFWPGTGSAEDRGPLGTVINVPLPAGSGHDDILQAFDAHVAGRAEAFAPQLVIVSAGFDAHAEDGLGELAASEDTFRELTRRVRGLADRHAGGRLVLALEGGYFLPALGRSLRACVEVLLEPG